jgi:hypothetical protein
MSEGETVEQLVDFMTILLNGAGVFFTIVSVYLAGLNYVLHNERMVAKLSAFLFVTLSLGMMLTVLAGAQSVHRGLVERLRELRAEDQLTAAGKAALSNQEQQFAIGPVVTTIDGAVVYTIYATMAVIYLALIYLTFLYKWRPHEAPSPNQLLMGS